MNDDELARKHQIRSQALQILISAKALAFCDVCGEFPQRQDDGEAASHAYAMAAVYFNRGKTAASSLDEMRAGIQAELAAAYPACPVCAEHAVE